MPSKCPFCRQKYIWSGAYEKHLQTAHANLDIVLMSTVRDTLSVETSILHHREESEFRDFDYESDPDPTRHELKAFTAHQSDTKIPDDSTSSLPSRQEDYPHAGEAIGDVDGFQQEHTNHCEDQWAPFSNAHGFKLVSWFIQGKVPKSRINEYFSSGLGNSTLVGYSSMHTLEKHLRSLEPSSPYLQWFKGRVKDSKRTLLFFCCNVQECVRYLLRQIAYQDDLVYAPRREFDYNDERIYAKMHTADWGWDVQVQRPNLLCGDVS